MTEQWLPVVGFEGLYEVSDLGRVKSFYHSRAGRVLRPVKVGKYDAVMLYKAGASPRSGYVHRLVLIAFRGEAPDGLIGCHNNGDHRDNRLDNLRWDTYRENMLDVVRHGHHLDANKTHCKWGHEFNAENTVIRRDGGRFCRPCNLRRCRERKARMATQQAA